MSSVGPVAVRRPALARLALCGALLLLAACGGSSPSSTPSPSAASGQRPALVQVENDPAARPQWGLNGAAVVYEYVTEGGISRFSVLYTTPPKGRIGPVRSARLVTVHLAQLYGAVIVYSGASTAVQHAIEASGAEHVDETAAAGDLYRIGDRPVPHNLVTDGDHLADLLQRAGAATSTPVSLWPRTSSPAQNAGRAVTRVSVPVSESETPTFTYDAAAGGWRRGEPGSGGAADAGSGAPVVAATLIVQQVTITDTGEVEDVNGAHGVDISVTGSGAAQVFTAGREYDATWTQPQSGPPSLTLPGGGAAPVAPGMVWICLVATGSTASAS